MSPLRAGVASFSGQTHNLSHLPSSSTRRRPSAALSWTCGWTINSSPACHIFTFQLFVLSYRVLHLPLLCEVIRLDFCLSSYLPQCPVTSVFNALPLHLHIAQAAFLLDCRSLRTLYVEVSRHPFSMSSRRLAVLWEPRLGYFSFFRKVPDTVYALHEVVYTTTA